LPACLDDWRIHDPLPPTATPEAIEGALRRYEMALEPADAKLFMVCMDALLEFGEVFGIKVPDQAAATRIYRDALSDLPADLIQLAIQRLRGTWTWGNRLPMPAEIREMVKDDHARRRLEHSRLQLARRQFETGRPYRSEFDERFRAWWEANKETILQQEAEQAAGKLQKVPADRHDGEGGDPLKDSMRRGLDSLAGRHRIEKDEAS